MGLPQIDIGFSGIVDDSIFDFRNIIETAIDKTISHAVLAFPADAELSVLLADDEKLQELNHQWRGLEKPTNVLSFPGTDILPGEPAGLFIGDIAVSLETTKREAELENKSFHDHFTHLIVHGFLHLFGYDHENDEQARQMESLEMEILEDLGISDPYESGHAK